MSLAQEFTEDVYISYEELDAMLNYQNTHAVWTAIQEYRKPYEWQLERSDKTMMLVLTPLLLSQCYELEQMLRFYQTLFPKQHNNNYMLQAALNPENEPAFYLNNLVNYFKGFSFEQVSMLSHTHILVQLMAVRCFCVEINEAAAFCLNRYFLSDVIEFFSLEPVNAFDATAELKMMIQLAKQKLKVKFQMFKYQQLPIMNKGNVDELHTLYPFLSSKQIEFYCTHQKAFHYYTAADYAKWHQCSNETARTSLNELVQLGWYKKQKVGKKYVYMI